MRRAAAVVFLLIASACTSRIGSPPAPTTSAPAVETTAVSTTLAPTTTSAPTPPAPNPITDREIPDELIAIMPMQSLGREWPGFSLERDLVEDNEAVVAFNAQAPRDEADDVAKYGRLLGHRTVHRPQALALTRALAVDTWVQVFEDDQGASGYLQDFVRDAAKDLDTGHRGDLRVLEILDFAVDPLGDEQLGLILHEVAPRTGKELWETLIGFRIGRLLAFVSVLQSSDIDTRIAAQELAEVFTARILDVLDGRILPAEAEIIPRIGPFAFRYEQTLTERYRRIVFPVITPQPGESTEPGGDAEPEPPPPGEDTGSEAEGGDDAGEEPTTTTSLTTTTTIVVPVTERGSVTATGFVAGNDVDCELTFSLLGGVERRRYIVVGDEAWVQTGGSGPFEEAEPTDEAVIADLLYCPGWGVSMKQSGLEAILVPGTGVPERVNGVPAERFDLELRDLVAIGLAPLNSGGVDFDGFSVWLATDQAAPWILAVELEYGGSADALEDALGPGFVNGADITLTVDYEIERLDDPTIVIEAP